MFGFHRRARSLIPVGEMEKMEKMEVVQRNVQEETAEAEIYTPQQNRNMVMIYLLFLAEAFMAASLASQISTLLPNARCMDAETSFLRSILQCAYYLGSAAGVAWGALADRVGRRPVALAGLSGMSLCCLFMAFTANFPASCVLRFIAGALGAASTVSGLSMLSDVTHESRTRTKTKLLARLPAVALCGELGPHISNLIRQSAQQHFEGILLELPGLGTQAACGVVVIGLTVMEFFLLQETLPELQQTRSVDDHVDCEKAAFLGQSQITASEESLNISIIEARNDDAAVAAVSRISIAQMLASPSILLLLASCATLLLHGASWDMLFPHIASSAGIPCSWLTSLMLAVRLIATIGVLHYLPRFVEHLGSLSVYKRVSLIFPALYIVAPLIVLAITAVGLQPISLVVGLAATLLKTALVGSAQVLVILLVFSAAPDASSTGTLVGVISFSQIFRAFAIGSSGISYYLADDYSALAVNATIMAILTITATLATGITWQLRETTRVGTDIPESCLKWEGLFDAESDEETGF